METVLGVLLILAVLGTLGVLVVGIVAMARGGEFNKKYSNKLMRLRLLMQGIAIVLFVAFMMVSDKT